MAETATGADPLTGIEREKLFPIVAFWVLRDENAGAEVLGALPVTARVQVTRTSARVLYE